MNKSNRKPFTYIVRNKKGDITVALFPSCLQPYAALNNLCGSITNFFGTPASNSP